MRKKKKEYYREFTEFDKDMRKYDKKKEDQFFEAYRLAKEAADNV